jgi:hypothetical protein
MMTHVYEDENKRGNMENSGGESAAERIINICNWERIDRNKLLDILIYSHHKVTAF